MAKRGGFPGGAMPGNMNNLMKQAQRMQRQMEEGQKELETKEFTASAGGGKGRERYCSHGGPDACRSSRSTGSAAGRCGKAEATVAEGGSRGYSGDCTEMAGYRGKC